MWTRSPISEVCHTCAQPFSFFFDLVAVYWKSKASFPAPLHRICTLARLQGAQYVLVRPVRREDVDREVTALDAAFGGGGEAEIFSLSFFCGTTHPSNIAAVQDDALIADIILINFRIRGVEEFTHSYVYEAVSPSPPHESAPLKSRVGQNASVLNEGLFRRTIAGREFLVRGVYYAQQNGVTNVCAHACLRMAVTSALGNGSPLSNEEINVSLNLTQPADGLTTIQVVSVIDQHKPLTATVIECVSKFESQERSEYCDGSDVEIDLFTNLDAGNPEDRLPLDPYGTICSIIESGCLALVVFSTSREQHVVTVFGLTFNSDEWHPEAVQIYAGPPSAAYIPSSLWADHLLIHDDNLGPYYALNKRSFSEHADLQVSQIICVSNKRFEVNPDWAMRGAAVVLAGWLKSLARIGHGKWCEYILGGDHKYVLRPILISRNEYVDHLRLSRGHDKTAITPSEVSDLTSLPDQFWMVEFSLPQLYTGNQSKLGELLLSTERTGDPFASAIALRLPSLFIKVLKSSSGQMLAASPTSLKSHSPVYRRGAPGPTVYPESAS